MNKNENNNKENWIELLSVIAIAGAIIAGVLFAIM